jgi:hypothetical protein
MRRMVRAPGRRRTRLKEQRPQWAMEVYAMTLALEKAGADGQLSRCGALLPRRGRGIQSVQDRSRLSRMDIACEDETSPPIRLPEMPRVQRPPDTCPIDIDEVAEAYVMGRMSPNEAGRFANHWGDAVVAQIKSSEVLDNCQSRPISKMLVPGDRPLRISPETARWWRCYCWMGASGTTWRPGQSLGRTPRGAHWGDMACHKRGRRAVANLR